VQWCVGMFSSGSTWAVHAIRSLGNALLPGEPSISVFADTIDQLPAEWSRSDRLVIKSHDPDEAVAKLLLMHADRIWVTIRDPRDCVASLMTYMHADFDFALDAVAQTALQCERFGVDQRSVVLRYEDGFIDDPATLDRFAGGFSQILSPRDRDRMFLSTRRPAIEKMIEQFDPNDTVDDGLPGHRVHVATQWHTHHVNRTGEVGRWRHTLTEAQAGTVEERIRFWMVRFGYLP
jgi:hypothetical protein